MKTRYKITIIVIVIIFSILFIPPNVAAFSCNTLQIKDVHCHVVGMTFFGIPFDTSIYHWFGWNERIGCGGINAKPDKIYPCIGIRDYWGYPAIISEFSKLTKNHDEKTVRVEGKIAEEICAIMDDECPPYYIGNIQDDDSIMIGFVISNQEKIKHYQFLIKNDTLSYNVTENKN